MARIKGFPIPPKAPSMRKTLIVSTWRGIPYVASWPRKRGPSKHPKVREQNEKFRQVGVLNKYTNWQQQVAALEASAGTPFYPRDVLTMMNFGTLLAWREADGRVIYSMSNQKTVSDSLDVLSQYDGSILARKNGLWIPVIPGAPYQVLTSFGDDDSPRYESQGPNIGGHSITAFVPTSQHPGTAAIKGFFIELQQSIRVTNLIPSFDGITGESYKVEIWKFDGTKITEKVAESAPVIWATTAFARRRFLMTETPVLEGGETYAFLFLRTSATGTSSNGLWFRLGVSNGGWPANDQLGLLTFTQTSLSVNDVPAFIELNNPACLDGIFLF